MNKRSNVKSLLNILILFFVDLWQQCYVVSRCCNGAIVPICVYPELLRVTQGGGRWYNFNNGPAMVSCALPLPDNYLDILTQPCCGDSVDHETGETDQTCLMRHFNE